MKRKEEAGIPVPPLGERGGQTSSHAGPLSPRLISFDIDGTLEVGDPPGSITMDMVREAKGKGYLIGSCSDRTISAQKEIWEEHKIAVDFVCLKHQLDGVKARFLASEYYHVGDTDMDRHYAEKAGFQFFMVDGTATRPGILTLFL